MAVLVAGLGAVGWAAPAVAADESAEALIRRAIEMRRRLDDEGALVLLRQAYDMSHSPRAAGQLGICEQALGRWVDSETHLLEALKDASDAWVKKNNATLLQSLSIVKAKIGRVEISGDPAGATVLVNGASVGQLPLSSPVRVAEGEVEVELQAAGYARASKSFHVEGGQFQTIVLRATKETPQAAGGPEAAHPPQADLRTAPPNEGSDSTGGSPATEQDNGASTFRRSLKFIGAGLAVVGAGVGIYGVLHNHQQKSDFDLGCGLNSMNMAAVAPNAPSNYTQQLCDGYKSGYQNGTTIAVVGFVSAGVFAAAGVVAWLTEPGPAEAPAATAWSCVPAVDPHGAVSVGCALRF
jgi:hypothetical protein